DAIVESYRKIIVLMSDEATLTEADRPLSFAVGKLLFDRNTPRLELLTERLFADLDAASSVQFRPAPALVEAFLDRLESTADWHDADKLVFRDLIRELIGRLGTLPTQGAEGQGLVARLAGDREALDEIQALYDAELEKVFSRFQPRGMTVTREAWDDYLAFLRSLYTAQSVLDAVRPDVSIAEPVRETEPTPAKKVRTVSGHSLPARTLVLTFDDGPHP
ncbi:MAG: hypothetical protein GY711_11290, partial [bacterium]|nr:hypothetical protein [bacterium]